MKVGYLGPSASFTHTATTKAFPHEELVAFATIPACLKAVERGLVEVAIVPIENTIEGTVNTTLDYLHHQVETKVGAEIILPISQQFMVHEQDASNWQKTTRILSHPQALAQSQEFISEHFPDAITEPTTSTAAAAQYVSSHPGEKIAAIGPKMSADEYKLTIVQGNIQDIEVNQTRFWVVGKEVPSIDLNQTTKKISISVKMPNNMPGSLHKALSVFSWREINLSKIESRPLKTILGEYFFLMDILEDKPLELIENAFEEIRLMGGQIKLLGNYQVFAIDAI